jgi:hypothetical protein
MVAGLSDTFQDIEAQTHGQKLPLERPRVPEAVVWLVCFQILRESVQDIAAIAGRDPQIVRRTIEGLAALLELSLAGSPDGSRRQAAGRAQACTRT